MNFNNLLNQILGTVQKSGKSVSDSPLNSFGGGALVGGASLKAEDFMPIVNAAA